MVEAIDRETEVDFKLMVLPPAVDSGYQLNMSDQELTMSIGRTVRDFFTLLNYSQPKSPQLVGVVVIKEKVKEEALETAPSDVEEVALPVITKQPDPVLEPVIEEIIPEEAAVEVIVPSKQDKGQILRQMEGYREQVRILTQVVAEEKKLLATQQKIQVLQQVNRSLSPQLVQSREERIQKIQLFEKQIKDLQERMGALQQTLQDI